MLRSRREEDQRISMGVVTKVMAAPQPGLTQLGAIMTALPVTVDAEASILAAARLMLQHDVGGLPVFRQGVVAGFVSRTDLLGRLVPRVPAWWWKVCADHERLTRQCQRAAGVTVGQIMSHPAVVGSADDTIETAARLLHRHGIGRLPVLDHDHLVGIVTR